MLYDDGFDGDCPTCHQPYLLKRVKDLETQVLNLQRLLFVQGQMQVPTSPGGAASANYANDIVNNPYVRAMIQRSAQRG